MILVDDAVCWSNQDSLHFSDTFPISVIVWDDNSTAMREHQRKVGNLKFLRLQVTPRYPVTQTLTQEINS